MRVYWLRNIVLSIPPIMCYTAHKGRRRQKMSTTISISVMCSVGSLTCGILSLVLPLIALAKQKNALLFAAVSMGLCSLALLGQIFEYNVRVYAQDFSAPSGYIVRYSVLRSRTVPVGGCCKCRRMHIPDETQRKITPATSIYHGKYIIKPPLQAVLLFRQGLTSAGLRRIDLAGLTIFEIHSL